MATYSSLLCIILLCSASLFILPSSSFPITIQLSRNTPRNTKDILSDIAKSSLKRAYHLKHRSKDPSTLSTPLYPISYPSSYVLSLSLGTPSQNLPVIFDTGSSLVWVPCTSNYFCNDCVQTKSNIAFFKPKRSSSKRSVSCSDKKCRWLDSPISMGSCSGCSSCRRPCAYNESYGTGAAIGHAISDNLHLQGKVISDFFVGCTSFSDGLPQGIVGFGRNPMSLPNQLKLSKFSYCLVSHRWDDTGKSSPLILGDSGDIPGIKYTPLLKNPPMLPYNVYYYVHLVGVTVGEKAVTLAQEVLVPDTNGNGGTIVDSGTTLTTMASVLFDPITKEFMAQLTPALRKRVMETTESTPIGNIICFNVKGLQRRLDFPRMVFHFEGGVEMELGVANYFDNGGDQLCLPFANSTLKYGPTSSGPALILGNYQQFNFQIEFDLQNRRLGVNRKNCDSS